MELSFNKLQNLSNLKKISNAQKSHRKCANKSSEIDLLTNESVWIYKHRGKNWCFKVSEIPELLETRVNPYTGERFSSKALSQMSRVKQRHVDSFEHQDKILPLSYLSHERRLAYIQDLQKGLLKVHRVLKTGTQCLTDAKPRLLKYLRAVRTISAGSFGSVSEGCYPLSSAEKCEQYPYRFAIKESRIDKRSLKKQFNARNDDWHEPIILRDLINPLVKNRICPNLPLLVDTFTCEACSMRLLEGKYKGSCMVSILELADGTLEDFLKSAPREQELWSALFQLLAALHTVQFYYQMFHNDIKCVNILYYNVVPGGYWRYTIHGNDYYIPNLGKLFVLSDFGVSYPLHPQSDLTDSLGIRYTIIADNKCSPISSSTKEKKIRWNGSTVYFSRQYRTENGKVTGASGLELSQQQQEFLREIGVPVDTRDPLFYAYSEIVPPLEFRYDLQDILRSFVGGKRTTQEGSHSSKQPLTAKFREQVSKYVDHTEKDNIRTPSDAAYFATAGYLIGELFSKWRRHEEKSLVIDHYDIS